jgi:broad specificity phosphatase PhoE
MTQEIYIIRHAHVAYDTQLSNKYKVPHYKEHLTPLGWAQALELDYLLGKSGLHFEKILSSDYCRTIETITPYAIRTKTIIHEKTQLRELKMKEDATKHLQKSRANQDYKTEDGESWNEGSVRLHNLIQEELKQPFERIAVVTHGILIEAFIKKYLEQDFRTIWPDVIKLVLKDGKYFSCTRVVNLVPNNASDYTQLGFYPVIEMNK